MTLRFHSAVLLFLMIYSGTVHAQEAATTGNGAIAVQGLTVSYEKVAAPKNIDADFSGLMRIVRDADGAVILERTSQLIPGCGSFPALSTPDASSRYGSLFLFCGGSGGQSLTITAIRVEGAAFQEASMDSGPVTPDLKFQNGTYQGLTIRRELFGDGGLRSLPWVQSLDIDAPVLRFSVSFGGTASRRYLDYLDRIRAASGEAYPSYAAEVLAALSGTQDSPVICAGVADLIERGKSRKSIDDLALALVKLGYPDLGLDRCQDLP